VFSPGKSRDSTVKVCSPKCDAKGELNRRSEVCEVLAGTGISRHVKWTSIRVARPVFRFGRPAPDSYRSWRLLLLRAHRRRALRRQSQQPARAADELNAIKQNLIDVRQKQFPKN